jgi:transcriptional regulator with XRE-family HTH domain
MIKFDGAQITIARQVKGLSQLDLAKLIGAQQHQVSQWEAEKIYPGVNYLAAICNALGASPRFFFVPMEVVE